VSREKDLGGLEKGRAWQLNGKLIKRLIILVSYDEYPREGNLLIPVKKTGDCKKDTTIDKSLRYVHSCT